MMWNVWQDLGYATRVLVKRPAFAIVVLIPLALGIGANSALFSAVHAIILQPLPYENPETEFWVPLTLQPSRPGMVEMIPVIARLREGVTVEQPAPRRKHSSSVSGSGLQKGTPATAACLCIWGLCMIKLSARFDRPCWCSLPRSGSCSSSPAPM